ncbi:MAG: hypothetical protein AB7S71_22900 [Dongiaceae bacterium]
MRRIGFATSAAAAALFVPTLALAAAAPPYCAARNDVLTKLANDFREQPASVALTSDGQLLEVLKSDTKLTWSILITSPNGVSCLVAAGESWQDKRIDPAALGPQT